MIEINKLQINNIKLCIELINFEINEKIFFKSLVGQKIKLSHSLKKINLSFDCFYNKKLVFF